MAAREETTRCCNADPITGTWTTMYFVFKYSKSVFEAMAKTNDSLPNMEDYLADWATSMTSFVHDQFKKKIRFVGIVEEIATCKASFHQTTKDESNIFILKTTPVMVVSIKGPIDNDSHLSRKPILTQSGPDMLTSNELYEVYTNLLTKLTNECKLDIHDIFIDRIEMVCDEERELIKDFTLQHKPDTNNLEQELKRTKKELERAQKKLNEVEKKHSMQIQQLQEQMKEISMQVYEECEDQDLDNQSLTTSLKSKRRRKKKSKSTY